MAKAPNPIPTRIHNSMWELAGNIIALESGDLTLSGIYANKPGYHNTRDANAKTNYSVTHADDKAGPGDKAAAVDITSRSAQRGDYRIIAKYTQRLLSAAKARDPRMAGWREFFGQADSDSQVEGWDIRKGRASVSDKSHLWHIHISEVRRYVTSYTNKHALLSVLKGETLDRYLAAGGKLVAGQAPPALGDRVLKRGMQGQDVRTGQERLNDHGANIAADGDFGPATEAAVIAFQRARTLAVDGVIGPKTTAALKATPGLAVDGRLGPKTVRRWQQVMGTPADGVISNPSELVRAVQRVLRSRVDRNLVVDGRGIAQDGRRYHTVSALQRYLRTPVDSVMSRPTSTVVKALQHRLNAGRF